MPLRDCFKVIGEAFDIPVNYREPLPILLKQAGVKIDEWNLATSPSALRDQNKTHGNVSARYLELVDRTEINSIYRLAYFMRDAGRLATLKEILGLMKGSIVLQEILYLDEGTSNRIAMGDPNVSGFFFIPAMSTIMEDGQVVPTIHRFGWSNDWGLIACASSTILTPDTLAHKPVLVVITAEYSHG